MRGAIITAILAGLLTARGALASLAFPSTMADHLRLRAHPACSTCHLSDNGGDAVARPFGRTAVGKYGLVKLDTERLKRVLDAMERNEDDSDDDRMGDIAELRNDRDPNVNDETGQAPGDPPRFGFYCATVPGRRAFAGAPAAWLAGLFLVAVRLSSRRGAHRCT